MCIEHAKAKRDSFRGAKNEESSDEGEECERDGRRQRDRESRDECECECECEQGKVGENTDPANRRQYCLPIPCSDARTTLRGPAQISQNNNHNNN